jgi:hypothetical protein
MKRRYESRRIVDSIPFPPQPSPGERGSIVRMEIDPAFGRNPKPPALAGGVVTGMDTPPAGGACTQIGAECSEDLHTGAETQAQSGQVSSRTSTGRDHGRLPGIH